MSNFNQRAINAIRYIGLKSIQQAKGGHVGMAISAAPITYTLYTKFININPNDGKWINRDRFVLSGGHGSMSLYPIFFFSGLLTKEDMMNFKTEDSKTPGHPEFEKFKDNFIDASTGPLGQGLAMAVGMALAQKIANRNTKNLFSEMFTNYTYVVCGDGDLQEGISYEAMAIAGKHKLNKLIVLHDSNKYQLDSSVEAVSVENIKQRVEANNWYYQKCSNNPEDIEQAINNARNSDKPSFIEVETIIAEGLKVANSNKGHHGFPLDEDIEQFQEYFGTNFKGWEIDEDILDYFKENVANRGLRKYKEWQKNLQAYKMNHKDVFEQLEKIVNNDFDYRAFFKNTKIEKQNQATRVYLKSFLSELENKNPFAIATCADLSSSTNIVIGNKDVLDGGQNLLLGIREFAMAAIINGFNLYGIFKIIGGTFLTFADYMKSAMRIGAMMHLPSIYAFTHDSYLVGGDGPTHQPYDQLPMLRAVDNLFVHRPADEEELRLIMIESFNSKNASNVIVLTRQNLKSLNIKIDEDNFNKYGMHVVHEAKNPDYVIAASGSEVQLALEIAERLSNTRVISIPCLDKAIKVSDEIKKTWFKAKKALITMEASSDYKWLNLHLNNQKNIHLGAHTFGKSMDGEVLYKQKGFDADFVVKNLKKL